MLSSSTVDRGDWAAADAEEDGAAEGDDPVAAVTLRFVPFESAALALLDLPLDGVDGAAVASLAGAAAVASGCGGDDPRSRAKRLDSDDDDDGEAAAAGRAWLMLGRAALASVQVQ